MKRITLILMLLIPAFILSQTSGKLSGIVSSDGEPLVGANILIDGTSFGAASDVSGQYYIVDVPVGTYTVEAQYIGYKKLAVEAVRVNANLTTELNFNLEVAAVEGEEISVTAERPLIQKNATNSTAIIDQEVVRALPIRNVGDIVALQAGAVGGNIRGSRSTDNAYYVDGVLMKNDWSGGNLVASLSQKSMQEIAFQAGGFSAEYGGANGGVVNVATNSGGEKISGSFEYLSDLGSTSPGTDPNALYSYGKNLVNITVGGPITNNIRFFTMIEQDKTDDASPSFTPVPFMDREIITQAQFVSNGYDTLYTWEKGDYPDKVLHYERIIRDNQANSDSLTAGVANYDTTHILGSNYRRLYGKKRMGSNQKTTLTGNLLMDFRPFRFKVGFARYDFTSNPYSHGSHALNWDANSNQYESLNNVFYLNATMSLSPKSYVKAIASLSNYSQQYFNSNFTPGTKDDARTSNFEKYGVRTTTSDSYNYYLRSSGRNPLSMQDMVYKTNYGTQRSSYTQSFQDRTGLRLDYLNQVGVHEVKAGFEYYNTQLNRYSISQAFEIAQKSDLLDVNHDGSVGTAEVGDQNNDGTINSADYDLWRFYTYRNAYVDNLGYDIFGEKTSKYGFDKHGSAPGKSVTNRFYVQDKIELKDVVVQVGLSFESWNPNTMAPDSDGDGVGDAEGFRNIHLKTGRIDKSGTQTGSLKWEKVATHSAILPRIGFSFPVTDRTVFRANYGTYMQAPALSFVYLTDSGLTANATQGNMTVSENPAIKPERTTQYEVGFAQQIGEFAAVEITGFYKESRDYLMMKNHEVIDGQSALMNGAKTNWAQYMNGDYGTTQGFTASLSMRRIKGVLAQVNYSYMTARGTGSSPGQNFTIAWIGGTYPVTINRLDFDQRHTGNVILDYRNPLGFGVNAVYTFGSGQAYTPGVSQSEVFGRGWGIPTAAINSGSKPWTARMDLRADYNLNVGGTDFSVYLLVKNALNRENVYSVYEGSGQVANDAWLETAEGQTWIKGQEKEFPAISKANGGPGAEQLYLDRLATPGRWGTPRTVRFGIEVSI